MFRSECSLFCDIFLLLSRVFYNKEYLRSVKIVGTMKNLLIIFLCCYVGLDVAYAQNDRQYITKMTTIFASDEVERSINITRHQLEVLPKSLMLGSYVLVNPDTSKWKSPTKLNDTVLLLYEDEASPQQKETKGKLLSFFYNSGVVKVRNGKLKMSERESLFLCHNIDLCYIGIFKEYIYKYNQNRKLFKLTKKDVKKDFVYMKNLYYK